jgi:hypothetical protein
MHSLQISSPIVFNNSGFPRFPPTHHNMLVLFTLYTCSNNSLLSLQSVQQICGVFSLTLFSPNSKIIILCTLAPAQFPPGRALQNVQQLYLMFLLCTVSPPRCSITLRLLPESVIILVCPLDTFSLEFEVEFRYTLLALAHIVLNTLSCTPCT